MSWRIKTESFLEKMGVTIALHPKKIIFIILTLSMIIISNVPKITIDTSTEGFLHKYDPALTRYEEFKKQFGQDEMIFLAVKTKDIFDIDFLHKLKELHVDLKNNIPHLNDINSLINARNTRGEGDILIVEDLFENWPQNEVELKKIKNIAVNNELYKNLLFNEDKTLTTIIIEPSAYENSVDGDELEGFADESIVQEEFEFLTDESKGEMLNYANEIAQKYNSEDFEVYLAGSMAVNDFIKKSIQTDMQKFVKLVLLMMLIFLFIVFRRLSGVVLPIFIVLISLLSTVGVMSLSGTPFTIPTQILPSFLLAVGIGATVHLLVIFYKHFNENGSKEKAISYALGHSGLAIIMTSITTAAGLLSFGIAELAPVADLGIFAAIGIMIALINTIVLLPTILAVLPIKPAKMNHLNSSMRMDKFLIFIANFSFNHAKTIVLLGIAVFVASVYFAAGIKLEHESLSWLPESSSVRISTELFDKELKGSVTMEVIIDTKKENGLYDSELLQKIDLVRKKAEAIENDKYFVGKGWSVAEVLKEIHRALHENRQNYYVITDNDALIPQEFLLFENSGSDDLEDFVDSSFSKTRLTFKLKWVEAGEYGDLNEELRSLLRSELGESVDITITGMIPLFHRTIVAAGNTLVSSYVTAFILISLIMIILLGSVKVGLVSMIPNILPVVMTLAFMNVTGMPLDMFTMLIGAIIIGLSVDDTVHFFHNFSRYHNQGLGAKKAIEETMLGTGRAMIATTIVLALGFYVYIFATMSNIVNFGILTGGAIIVALIADILLAPALLKLIFKDERRDFKNL
ncbi:efflux RND transporter permease subunit [Sulfurimonas sp.]|uniref:efflux RND transporter permease subunit n=1 Tax=Sulfurimonas sp. TaxID=2022749 RepID=UPI00263399A4|nr:efflux RND transporter permease subunit [Sulfurimonas sp.]MCW8895131.1 efflux RND transporter permease subunit [Sulfurimonas sp.]MCW9068105.1 efflux RND transporter permease subunit [Sulfurimonas sp.]